MKIDIDLVKDILEALEKSDGKGDYYTPEELDLGPIDEDIFFFHINKLRKANFIEAETNIALDGHYPTELTWEGQELLNAIRDKRVMEKLKKWMVNGAGTLSIELIMHQAIEILKTIQN